MRRCACFLQNGYEGASYMGLTEAVCVERPGKLIGGQVAPRNPAVSGFRTAENIMRLKAPVGLPASAVGLKLGVGE